MQLHLIFYSIVGFFSLRPALFPRLFAQKRYLSIDGRQQMPAPWFEHTQRLKYFGFSSMGLGRLDCPEFYFLKLEVAPMKPPAELQQKQEYFYAPPR